MKSILERALVHLLNEENEKAEELLHQFVIESAKSIHETLRESDDLEDIDLEEGERFFTEADLADAEKDFAAADLGDDLGEEVPEAGDAEDLGDDALDADLADETVDAGDLAGDDLEGETGDVESEIEEFESELADLQAKFDALVAEIEGEDAADEDELEAGDEVAADDALDAPEETADMGDEEEFDDITESIVDELQKISVPNEEGKGANGEQLLGNKESLKFNKPQPKPAAPKKGGEHSGFARETAPSSETLKGGSTKSDSSMRNVRASADAGNSKISKEGDKGAILNKRPAPNNKSVVTKPVGKK